MTRTQTARRGITHGIARAFFQRRKKQDKKCAKYSGAADKSEACRRGGICAFFTTKIFSETEKKFITTLWRERF
jgi:hypothetical protein